MKVNIVSGFINGLKVPFAGIKKLGEYIRHDLKNPLDMTVKIADKTLDNTVKTFTGVSEKKENMDRNTDEI